MPVAGYSTTAASNTAYNTAEGVMTLPQVNDTFRAVMADIRNASNDGVWIDYGGGTGSGNGAASSYTYVSGSSFSVPNANVVDAYAVGQRVKAVQGSTTLTGRISAVSFASPNTLVTVAWDSGSLTSGALTVYLSGCSRGYASSLGGLRFDLRDNGNEYIHADQAGRVTIGAGNAAAVQITHGNVAARYSATSTTEFGYYEVYRNRAGNGAEDHALGGLKVSGQSSTGTKIDYGYLRWTIRDPAAGTATAYMDSSLWLDFGGFAPLVVNRTGNPISGAALASFRRTNGTETTVIGQIVTSGTTGVAYNTTSDARLKDLIAPLGPADIEGIARLPVWRFRWKSDGAEDVGVMAQDVQKFAPHLVAETESGTLTLNYAGLVPYLLALVGELSERVAVLEAR